MEITRITADNAYKYNTDNLNKQNTKAYDKKEEVQDEYIKSSLENNELNYKNIEKVDKAAIQKLQEESERNYQHLKQLVTQLLERQGLTFKEIEKAEIDNEIRLEAGALIEEGGELSAEKVSDRIVEFAKAISGGDKGKLETLKGAIQKGFQEAAAVLGGELPDISNDTYQLVMEKLDTWAREE